MRRTIGITFMYLMSACLLSLPFFFNSSSEAVDTCWTYKIVKYGFVCTGTGPCAYDYGWAAPNRVCDSHTSTGYYNCEDIKGYGTAQSDVWNYQYGCKQKPCNYYSYYYCMAYTFREPAPNVSYLGPCRVELTNPGCTGD